MKNVSTRQAGLASQLTVLRPGTKMPVKVIAPSFPPARATALASTSDSPEQPDTRTRPPVGRTEAIVSGSRRGGVMSGFSSLDEGVEIGLPLAHEGAHAFFGFLRLVEQLHRAQHGKANAPDVLAVSVERALGERQCGR